METEKIIKKLLKKAEEVKNVDLKQEDVTEMSLEDFYEVKGEIYYNNNTFYKKSDSGWLMTRVKADLTENKVNLEIEKRVKNIEIWCNKFKEYVDNELNKKGDEGCGNG